MDFETEDLNNYISGYEEYLETKEKITEEFDEREHYDEYVDMMLVNGYDRIEDIRLSLQESSRKRKNDKK